MIEKIFTIPVYTRFVAVILFIVLPGLCHAQGTGPRTQDDPWQVSVSAGAISGVQIVRAVGQGFGGDHSQYYDNGGTPCFSVTGKYFLSGRIAIGLTLSQQSVTGYTNYDNVVYSGTPSFNYKINFFTVAPEMTFVYTKRRYFWFYSLYGMGVTFTNRQYSNYAPGSDLPNIVNPAILNAQLTPLGLGFGGKLKGNLEFGWGYKGLFCGGISYSF